LECFTIDPVSVREIDRSQRVPLPTRPDTLFLRKENGFLFVSAKGRHFYS
jgi:hypothetical protein